MRLKNIDETKNHLIQEINQNELISKKHKKIFITLKYIEQSLILASTDTGRVSISAFASLIAIPTGITSSAIVLSTCTITARIKKYKSIIKKKKHDTIVSLAKSKLNRIEVLISKSLIDSNISHDIFVSINNVLREYEEIKEEILENLRRLNPFIKDSILFIKQCYHIVWSVEKI